MLPAIPEAIRIALLETIVRLNPVRPTEVVDRFLDRVMVQGVSADMRKLCGNATSGVVVFAMGNQAAASATDATLIALLKYGAVIDKFIGTQPVPQQCYLLERGDLKVLLMIRSVG